MIAIFLVFPRFVYPRLKIRTFCPWNPETCILWVFGWDIETYLVYFICLFHQIWIFLIITAIIVITVIIWRILGFHCYYLYYFIVFRIIGTYILVFLCLLKRARIFWYLCLKKASKIWCFQIIIEHFCWYCYMFHRILKGG